MRHPLLSAWTPAAVAKFTATYVSTIIIRLADSIDCECVCVGAVFWQLFVEQIVILARHHYLPTFTQRIKCKAVMCTCVRQIRFIIRKKSEHG